MRDLRGKVLVGLASVSMLGGIALGSVQAFAAFPNTDAEVTFRRYDGPGEGGDGVLSLRNTPPGIDFGTHTIDAGNAVTFPGDLNGADYVALRDDRPNTDPYNWQLQATASNLTSGASTISEVDSGAIELTSTTAIKLWTPNGNDPVIGNDHSTQSLFERQAGTISLPLDGNTSKTIAATDNTYNERGRYAVPVDSANLKLVSQMAHAGKTYRGTITWTLNSTP